MLDQVKLVGSIEKKLNKKHNGKKAFILSAAIASLVASGETGSGGTGGTGGAGGGNNNAPTLANDKLTISVDENQSVVVKVDATDSDELTFAISGDDAAFFSIDAAAGTLAFIANPNFEDPADSGSDNVYNIIVTVTDEGGLSVNGTAAITVKNVNEAVSFASDETLEVDVVEGDTAVVTMVATDIDGDELTYALSGVDAALFEISAAGAITFKTAPDFETKTDDGGDGVYNITVTVKDPDGLSDTRDVEIKVTNVNEGPEFASNDTLELDIYENQPAVATMVAVDPEGDDLTYSLTGDDAEFFEISAGGVVTVIGSLANDTPLDEGGDNVYDFDVVATDEHGLSSSRHLAVAVNDVPNPEINVVNRPIKLGQEFLVNSNKSGDQGFAAVTSLQDGKFIVVWETDDEFDPESGSDIAAQIYDIDGEKIGFEFAVMKNLPGNEHTPDVTLLANGNFVVSWRESSGVKVRIFDENGTGLTDDLDVNTNSVSGLQNQKVTALADGGFALIWQISTSAIPIGDGDSTSIHARVFDALGNSAMASEVLVNEHVTGAQQMAGIAGLKNGGFVALWINNESDVNEGGDGDETSVNGRVFDENGVAVDGQFLANTNSNSSQSLVSVVALDDGGFAAVWFSSNTQVSLQKYNIDGTPNGDEIDVGNGLNPKFDSAPDGGFVVTWYIHDFGESDRTIAAQRVDKYGNLVGEQIFVNSANTLFQIDPDVAVLDGDTFAVVWVTEDFKQDGSDDAVKGQLFKSAPNFKYDEDSINVIDISVQFTPQEIAEGGSVEQVTIAGVVDDISFNHGKLESGVLTLSEGELDGLTVSFSNGFNGQAEFIVSVLTSAGNIVQKTLPIRVGNPLDGGSGDNDISATSASDHVDGEGGYDTFILAGEKADYSFALVGEDVEVTQISAGNANVDYIHSIEVLQFAVGPDALIDELVDEDDITGYTDQEFENWLEFLYDYNPTLVA